MKNKQMVSYTHKKDSTLRFKQYKKDPIPNWAIDIQPYFDFYDQTEEEKSKICIKAH